MKHQFFLLLFLFTSKVLCSQNAFAEIKGTVFSTDLRTSDTLPVENVEVVLMINDSIRIKQLTNQNGTYAFSVKKFRGKVVLYLITSKKAQSPKRKGVFFQSKEMRTIEDLSKSDIFIADFTLQARTICYGARALPQILFISNSLDLSYDKISSDNYMTPDSAIHSILVVLNNDPTLVIEICGHADSKEKNQADLSLQRASTIRQKLIALGVNEERLKTRGFGAEQVVMNEAWIKKAKTANEKEQLRLLNRRVEIKILSWDYKPKSNQ